MKILVSISTESGIIADISVASDEYPEQSQHSNS